MALRTILRLGDVTLTTTAERRIQRYLQSLERRLNHHPDPSAELVVTPHDLQRRFEVDLRVQLGPLGQHLVSHVAAETVDLAVRQAVSDVERQLERKLAKQRGEPAFGTPSRRLPRQTRPAALGEEGEVEVEVEEEGEGESEEEAVEFRPER